MAIKKQSEGKRPAAGKKSLSSIYWLIALLLILFAGAIYVLEKLETNGHIPWHLPASLSRKEENLVSQSLKLEEAINQALSTCGVSDSDVITSSTSEEEENNERWYHYEKQIKLPAHIDIGNLQQTLIKAVNTQNGQIWENQLEDKNGEKILIFKAGFQKQVTHYLVIGQLLSLRPSSSQPGTHQVALIIDDVGNNEDIHFLSELGIPLTVAILPQLRYSAYSAAYAQKKS